MIRQTNATSWLAITGILNRLRRGLNICNWRSSSIGRTNTSMAPIFRAASASLPPEALRYRSNFGFMFTSSGLPAIAPPWTTLTAYDLNQGTIKWQVPLGEVPELAAKGIKNTGSHFPKVGPIVTAGG